MILFPVNSEFVITSDNFEKGSLFWIYAPLFLNDLLFWYRTLPVEFFFLKSYIQIQFAFLDVSVYIVNRKRNVAIKQMLFDNEITIKKLFWKIYVFIIQL